MRHRIGRAISCVGILTVLLSASSAYAYRAARILADQAEVKDAPGDEAPAKSVMPKGTRVNTSDQATNGWYRVRSASDSGWVRESDLDFAPPMSAPPPSQPQPQTKRSRDPAPEKMQDREDQTEDTGKRWALKAFGGLDFWKASDLGTLVGSTSLQNGAGFGGEIDYFLSPRTALAFRIESLSKSSTGPATVTLSGGGTQTDNVSFSLSSVPVMVGLCYELSKGESFSLDIGAYLGEALSTQVTETDTSEPSPNVSQMSASAFTFLIAADLNWHMTNPFWLFAELGYRSLKTSQVAASSVGNGSLLGSSPFDIDLSGPVLNFGARINF